MQLVWNVILGVVRLKFLLLSFFCPTVHRFCLFQPSLFVHFAVEVILTGRHRAVCMQAVCILYYCFAFVHVRRPSILFRMLLG